MFDKAPDVEVVDAIGAAARAQNSACGRELEAIGELYARRAPEDDVDCVNWAIDGHENVVAEISAELCISRGRAGSRLRYAIALRERLPEVLGVLKSGKIDFRVMAAMVTRTDNIEDPALMAHVDAALAQWAASYMTLSSLKLEERIDWIVASVDPAGVRVPKEQKEKRFVEITPSTPGLAGIWANVFATDALALDQRLDQLAATVCDKDPRSKDQRRADAIGALVAGATILACSCGSEDCSAAGDQQPWGDIVLHLLAEQATVDGTSMTPGYLQGVGPVPAEMVCDLAKKSKLKPVVIPTGVPEKGYRPSKALSDFVRWRDLTCRFPGCDKPAVGCDLDHTRPWPAGSTHASNVKPYCRVHHLVKTFYTGPKGWSECQYPDGTITWTAPSGKTYTTKPGGALFFPILSTSTGVAPATDDTQSFRDKGAMMPRRKRTRAENRQQRIATERKANEARLLEMRGEADDTGPDTGLDPPF